MLIKSIRLRNLLSFGPESPALELRPLNVLIGPNGSGKSNLIEAFSLLRSTPTEASEPVRLGGGVQDWLWKGGPTEDPTGEIEAVVDNPRGRMPLRYRVAFKAIAHRFQIVDESIENEKPYELLEDAYFFYRYQNGHPVLNVFEASGEKKRTLRREDLDPEKSILAQRRDPDTYPEITYLGDSLRAIRIYAEWTFGRSSPPRLPQKADLSNQFLEADASNLALVLNDLASHPATKKSVLDSLRLLRGEFHDYGVHVVGGTAQIFLHESGVSIPATRLSDGTSRFLALLAVLCHPRPAPLICIEEPELGLHPDILPVVADLLKAASERCQLVVTTHSDILVDALTDTPESVVIFEKPEGGGTTMRRLDKKELEPWLEKYRLGTLWSQGNLGGNRW